jgi:hypothetical protein
MENEITGLKVVRWFNKKSGEFFWGIDAKVGRVWAHLKDDDAPLFFKTKREAAKRIKELAKEFGVL